MNRIIVAHCNENNILLGYQEELFSVRDNLLFFSHYCVQPGSGISINKKKEGKFVWCFVNGIRSAEEFYFNGEKNGRSLQWTPDGKMSLEGNYLNGNKDGIQTTWINSLPRYKETYINGKFISTEYQ